MEKQPRICCPLCDWVPRADSLWFCSPSEPGAGCRTRWNTFLTAGCCPGCGHYWAMTQCLSCKRKSPHEAWDRFPSGEDLEVQRERELEAV